MSTAMIENAKVMGEGQITVPFTVNLKINISKRDNYTVFMSPALDAMKTLQAKMAGKFEQVGLISDGDIENYIADIRSEIETR